MGKRKGFVAGKPHPNAETMAALVAFAAKEGRRWKQRLAGLWLTGSGQEGELLRRLRNTHGPTWLQAFTEVGKPWADG